MATGGGRTKRYITKPIVLLLLGFSIQMAAHAAMLYWVADCSHGIYQADPDSPDSFTYVATIDGNVMDIAADQAGNYLYWCVSSGYGSVGRINLATGTSEILIPGTSPQKFFHDIVLDEQNSKIYFSGYHAKTIYSANLDGSEFQAVFSRPELSLFPVSFDIDLNSGTIFYNYQGIRRVNLDGTGDTLVLEHDKTDALDMHVDAAVNRIFWSNGGRLRSAGLDGSGLTTILDLDYKIKSFTLDRYHKKIYWKSEIPLSNLPYDTQTYIHACNYDGTDLQTLFYLGDGICPVNGDLTVIPEPAAGLLLSSGAWVMHIYSKKRK